MGMSLSPKMSHFSRVKLCYKHGLKIKIKSDITTICKNYDPELKSQNYPIPTYKNY